MKRFLFTILFSLSLITTFAAHIKGGFFTYKYLGPGIIDPAKLRYKITLTVYTACNPSVLQLSEKINLTVFNGNSSSQYDNPEVNLSPRYHLKFY